MTSKPALHVLKRLPAQVHIRANPSPRNLAESKQIFAALQRYGEIISFRNLKYDIFNNTERERPLLAIFDSNEAAERAIAASPLTTDLPATPLLPSSSSKSLTRNPYATSSTTLLSPGTSDQPPSSKHESHPPTSSSLSSSSTPTANPLSITCTIEPSRHNYERATRRNPFYSTFSTDKHSPIYQDMRGEETATPLVELADVLQRTKSPTFATQRYGTRVHAQRLGADSLVRLWKKGAADRQAKERSQIRECGADGTSSTGSVAGVVVDGEKMGGKSGVSDRG